LIVSSRNASNRGALLRVNSYKLSFKNKIQP